MAKVLVVCDAQQGKLRKISREMLTAGRKLVEGAGGDLVAVAFGSGSAGLATEAGSFGATKLVAVSGASLDGYLTETRVAALAQVIEGESPDVLVFGASAAGKDLAPRIAARLEVGVASEVTGLRWSDGRVVARRPVYSGKAIATVEIDGRPAIVTCRPNAFPAEASGGGPAEVLETGFEPGETRSKLMETRTPETSEIPLVEADIVVSGGRGLKEAENFRLIRDLANALGAAAGASRAIVDAGWVDHQIQVGQTGRVVSPNLYIAVAISGAIQHLAGMRSSKHIVAINKDPEAPIFKVADLGVVGDAFEILPALTEEVRKAKAGA